MKQAGPAVALLQTGDRFCSCGKMYPHAGSAPKTHVLFRVRFSRVIKIVLYCGELLETFGCREDQTHHLWHNLRGRIIVLSENKNEEIHVKLRENCAAKRSEEDGVI